MPKQKRLNPRARRVKVAELKAQGLPAREIAEQLGVAKKTVDRDLKVIRNDPITRHVLEQHLMDIYNVNMAGQPNTAVALKAIETLAKLLGYLDTPPENPPGTSELTIKVLPVTTSD